MSTEGLVIGRTNAGKTSFCLRLARVLGIRELNWLVERTDGVTQRRRMNVREAEEILTSGDAHQTRELQTLILSVPRGKADKSFASPILRVSPTGFTRTRRSAKRWRRR